MPAISPITIDETTGNTVAIPANTGKRQVLLRIVGSDVWANFNEPAVAGECMLIKDGEIGRFWGERDNADVYLVTAAGESAVGYGVEGQSNMEVLPAVKTNTDGSSLVAVVDENGDLINVQNPFPTNSDSVYTKDINTDLSSSDGFTGGTVEDLFNDLTTTLTNATTDNPKTIILAFNRVVASSGLSIGDINGGTHQAIKIEAQRGGNTWTTLRDNSGSVIPFNARFYSFSTTAGNDDIGIVSFTKLRITFNTTATIALSNITINKVLERQASLIGLKPDGVQTYIGATRNSNLEVSIQEYGDTPAIDSFARLRISNPFTLFDSKQLHDNQPLFWNEVLGGSATSTHSSVNAETVLAVTSSASDYAIRQTKQRFNYQPGKSQLLFMTFRSPQVEGITCRVGAFDDDGSGNNLTPGNGIWFECDGTVSWNIAKNGTTTETATQANWNVDKLDGTGKSGITLDLSAPQILVVDFEWLGVGRVRVGFVIDGLVYYCHYFNHANDAAFSTVYMSSPNLPLRYDIQTDGTNGSSLQHICSTVISEGGVEKTGVLRAIESHNVFSGTLSIIGNKYALCGIRLKAGYKDVSVLPEKVSMVLGTNDAFKWELHLNPTVAGTWTYNDLANSSVQFAQIGTATNTQVTADGIIIANGGGSTSARGDSEALNTALRIGSTIAGVQDELVLVIGLFTNNLTAWAGFEFRELL